ncbi:hypothetical protein AB0I72_19105 [Nocardiopsis sp. NPDC049922]|uniref:hypothetical protein n=1 Tax=Nocardiopsis sp. NPDC049922 TaxID=3155157 RepID=UPI00340D8BCD
MGTIQEPTPAMNGWGVEMRRESVYVSDDIAEMDGPGRFTVRGDGVSLPAEHLPALIASVELAWDHWIRHGHKESEPKEAFTVTLDGDTVVMTGVRTAPSLAYAHEEGLATVHMLEPTYAELPDLYRKLHDALGSSVGDIELPMEDDA